MAERVLDVGALIESRPIGSAQWTVIGLCAFVAMLDGLDLQSIGLAAPAMIAQLHIAPQVFGFVFSAALAGLALGAFLLGPLADRVGRKRVLLGATFCFGVFTLATAYADDLPELLTCRFLTGLGLGGAMPSFISLASEYVPKARRATVISLLWAGFPLGGVIGGVLGSWIIPAYGWQSIFLVGGFVPILLSVILATVLPESVSFLVAAGKPAERIGRTLRRIFADVSIADGTQFEIAKEITHRATVFELFRSGRAVGTVLLWVSFFFAFMILVTNSSWSPILLRRVGIATEQTALALALYNFGSLFGSGAAGILISRLGVLRVLPPTLALGALAYAMVGWWAPSLDAVMIAQGLFGLSARLCQFGTDRAVRHLLSGRDPLHGGRLGDGDRPARVGGGTADCRSDGRCPMGRTDDLRGSGRIGVGRRRCQRADGSASARTYLRCGRDRHTPFLARLMEQL